MRESPESGWKTYALGILLTLVMATGGIVWNSTTARLSALEESNTAKVDVAKDVAVQLAVLHVSLLEMQSSLGKMESNQIKMVEKMDALVTNMLRDSQRWNKEMDRFSQAPTTSKR